MNYSRKRLFIASCMGMTIVGISFISLGSILPNLIDYYELSGAQAGLLTSMLPAGIIIGSLSFGPVADAFSYKLLLTISTTMTVLGLMIVGLSETYLAALSSFLIIGAGSGALNGGTNALVADINSHDPVKRSANLSLLAVFFGAGALLMPVYLATTSAYIDNNEAILYISLSIIPVLIWFLFLSYPAPKQTGGLDLKVYGRLTRDPLLILLCLILFFQSGLEGVVNNWTTSMLEISRGYGSERALSFLSLFILVFTITRLLISSIMRHTSARVVLYFSYTVMVFASLVLLLSSSSSMFILFLVLAGVGSAAGFPLVLSFIGELYQQNSGTAYSIAFFLALVGNITMNYSMGKFSELYDLEVYRYIVAIEVAALGLILFPALKRLNREGS